MRQGWLSLRRCDWNSLAWGNSKDGMRLIQTGEGALEEVHAMLNRLSYLAEQSANGTYQDEVDRESLQKELEQLCDEMGRILESANFNGIELFQDSGYEMERYVEPYYRDILARITTNAAAVENLKAAQSPREEGMTLEQLQKSTRPGELNIIYVEYDFTTTQTGSNQMTDTGPTYATGVNDPALNLVVDGTNKQLSEVLKTSIVPQTVTNLLKSYPAFSYLNGSSIGIGLRLYNNPNDSAMASVTGGVLGADTQSYMLSVNLAHITEKGANTTITPENRSKLESTIAHEMIHAFMYEATTAGMFGHNYTDGSFGNTSQTFPSWFIEGMAQTASGPGNWLKKPEKISNPDGSVTTITYGGLQIDKDSTEAEIKAAIGAHKLNAGKSATSASQYGTGYLACMYLGVAIAARVGGKTADQCADAASISIGLNQLLSEVINGSSLDAAIVKYTDFTSTADFQAKFNAGTAGNMLPFVKQLLTNTDSGMGGIATGDLTATDLADNADLSGVNLFNLDPSNPIIKNLYPNDHKTITGGTTGSSGTKPTEFTPLDNPKKEYGDFAVFGSDLSGVFFDSVTNTLKVSGTADVRIAMKSGVTGSGHNILVEGSGTVTLDGVNSTGTLTVKDAINAKVNTAGINEINVSIGNGSTALFDGTGQLKVSTFTADNTNTVRCNGGALIVGTDGTGMIGTGTTVTVDGASVAAGGLTGVLNSAGTTLEQYEIDWSKLSKLTGGLTSVSVDGVRKGMLLSSTDPGILWLDKKPNGSGFDSQKIVFSGVDASGKQVSHTYSVVWDSTAGQFQFSSYNVFEVTGGTEGTDWEFDGDTNTLKILKDTTALTIKGGTKTVGGETDYGTIKVEDGVNANLTLDGVEIDATKLGGNTAGIQLGNGSNVNLIVQGVNTITGSGEAAGIQLYGKRKRTAGDDAPQDSSLHIEMKTGSTLNATGGTVGGTGGAGIGIAWASTSKGSIEIVGEGTINANGGMGGAGIGGSEGGDMGNITIDGSGTGGLKIKAVGGDHGAGIGSGGWVGTYSTPNTQVVGNIKITGAVDIDASSKSHGTGIGSACHSTAGDITIGADPNTGADNSKIKIKANGGNDGAAIGSGWQGVIGEVTIWGGEITAKAGTNSCGIGSGMDGSIESITINGGTITAQGGWTDNGGNIGGFGPDKKWINVSMPNPNDLTIKAGPGEGMYITTGTFDKDGNQLFALEMGYINKLLGNGTVTSNPAGSKALVFPLSKITATMDDGTKYEWDNLKHMSEGDAYIWMKGQDIQSLTMTYTGTDRTDYTVKDIPLKYKNGLWRYTEAELPKEPPPKPGFTGSKPSQPGQDPDPTPVQPLTPVGDGGIILQIGTNAEDILVVPRFYLSGTSLKLDKLDISTQRNAMDSMSTIKEAINRVSEVRGSYGALSNRLEHNITNLRITSENLTDAESTLRDTDMAQEMVNYVRQNILSQTSQAMLAQCNQRVSDVMRLLQ